MRSPDAIRRLTKAFSRLPGIGERPLYACRILISSSSSIADELQDALGVVKTKSECVVAVVCLPIRTLPYL